MLINLEKRGSPPEIEAKNMGGFGSGRAKTSHLTTECLQIDMMQLRKHGYLDGEKESVGGRATYTDTEGKRQGAFAFIVKSSNNTPHTLELIYFVKREGCKDRGYTISMDIETTTPNYGGQRYWITAPCCDRRVRVVYLPTYGNAIEPMCRQCANLHYSSQRANELERKIAYEKHLLRNYGYYWACDAYHRLQEHHVPLTPYWQAVMDRSMAERHLALLTRLIASTKVMMNADIRNLMSLKSEEDQVAYFDFLLQQRGQQYAVQVVKALGASMQLERDFIMLLDEDKERLLRHEDTDEGDDTNALLDVEALIQQKESVLAELQALRAA